MTFFAFCGDLLLQYPLPVIAVLLILNLISLIVYAADKKKAQRGAWRTPEATLLALAWAFGSVGALIGMYVFRHKTKHLKFRLLVPLAFLVHSAFVLLCVFAACR